VLVALVVGVGYLAANPGLTTTAYTEFYLPNAGDNGTAERSLSVGETATFTVAVENYEHSAVTYRVAAAVNGTEMTNRSVRVENRETRNVTLSVPAPEDPGRYRVGFRLYDGDDGAPELTTRYWVRVQS
jgi:uncharacterized membrane protein